MHLATFKFLCLDNYSGATGEKIRDCRIYFVSTFSLSYLITLLLSLGQTLSTFHYTLLDKCRALLSVVERGWPNALDFSLDLELNIPMLCSLLNELQLHMRTLDNARQFYI